MWDVDKNVVSTARDGPYNNVAAYWPEKGELLTGSDGRLRIWTLPDDPNLPPSVQRELKLPAQTVPRAITLLSSQPGGPLDRAAVVLRFAAQNEADHLWIIDLESFRALHTDLHLWNGRGTMPAMTAVPGGRHVAVTGGNEHDLLVFPGDDLLAGHARRQTLRTAGITPHFAEFVRREEGLGLLFSEQPPPRAASSSRPPQKGDLVFDPQQGQVTSADAWRSAAPPVEGWELTHEMSRQGSALQTEVVVRSPDRGSLRIRLKPNQQVTAYAVLPPTAPLTIPMVAVASHDLGQPSLYFFNGKTGEPVRLLEGHVERIRSLAFSDDGRFLLSAGDDRMLCVWSLSDLNQTLGKRGALPGVALERHGDRLVVAAVTADSPPQLAKGDVLAGIVEQGRARRIPTPLEFYLALSLFRPGQTVSLSRARADGQLEEVPVRVGQGVDQRKPLFSWFVTRDKAEGAWQWIGWSPLGPFDASRLAAERLLGWHFNTGNPRQPTRFSHAGEYKKLRRAGLLSALLAGQPPPDSPLTRPEIHVSLKEPEREPQLADGSGPLVVHGRGAVLHVRAAGAAAEELSSVTWQYGAGPPHPCQEGADHEWLATLDDLPRLRQDQELRVVVRTAETEPQEFVETARLRYQLPPPLIAAVSPAEDRVMAKERQLTFRAHVGPATPGSPRQDITLVHRAGDKEVLRRQWTLDAPLDVEQPLELKPGDNTIRLVAFNRGAASETAAAETTIVERTVVFAIAPPRVSLWLAQPGDPRKRWPGNSGQPAIVREPVLRIEGEIAADEPLREADWQRDATMPRQHLAGFVPGQTTKLTAVQEVRLEPGWQTIRCTAKTALGTRTATAWKVHYAPPLPQVIWTSPPQDATLVAGRDEPRIRLTGRLRWPQKSPYPLEATLLLNGEPLPARPAIDAQRQVFSTRVDLPPGANTLQLRLSHAWDGVAMSEVRRVRYLRPPRVVGATAPKVVQQPLTDIVFRVESPSEFPLLSLSVGGRERPVSGAVRERRGPPLDLWTVAVSNVPLAEGPNKIALSARNQDGWAADPQWIEVTKLPKPAPPKAEIVFLNPAVDSAVALPQLKVRFTVKSASRVRDVFVQRGKQVLWRADPAQQAGGGGRPFEILAEILVELPPTSNVLEAVAINEGGASQRQVTVTYVPPPVRLAIDGLESDVAEQTVVPEIQEGGRPVFREPVSEGTVWVHGHIQWSDAAARRLRAVSSLFVTVNGFLQRPVTLSSATDLRQAWKAKIRLNRLKENLITLEVPGLPQDAANQTRFWVDCRNPDRQQRLHLLVVGVDQDDPLALQRRALESVQARRVRENELSTPVFPKGKIYGPLVGDVSRIAVINQLWNIRLAIKEMADAGNDVVLVYFRGGEAVEKGQFYMLSSESRDNPDLKSSAVSGLDLAMAFDKLPGAQVFLLDVQRSLAPSSPAKGLPPFVAHWPDEMRSAVLQCAWLRNIPWPAEAGLLAALQHTAPKATRLYEISTGISEALRQAQAEYGGGLAYDPYIPPDLRDLILRQP